MCGFSVTVKVRTHCYHFTPHVTSNSEVVHNVCYVIAWRNAAVTAASHITSCELSVSFPLSLSVAAYICEAQDFLSCYLWWFSLDMEELFVGNWCFSTHFSYEDHLFNSLREQNGEFNLDIWWVSFILIRTRFFQ